MARKKCYKCGGKGEVRCPKCHGKGCDVCANLMESILPGGRGGGYIKCESCNGKGYHEYDTDKPRKASSSISVGSSYTPPTAFEAFFHQVGDNIDSAMEKTIYIGTIIGAIGGIYLGFSIGGIGGAIIFGIIGAGVGYLLWGMSKEFIAGIVKAVPLVLVAIGIILAIILAIVIIVSLWGEGKPKQSNQNNRSTQAVEKASSKDITPEQPKTDNSSAKNSRPSIKIIGTVVDLKSKKGKTIGIALLTDNDSYTIVRKAKGAELVNMVGKKVLLCQS